MIEFGLPGVVGTLFGSAIGSFFVLRDKQRWVLRARKLAATHDLSLPEDLAVHVAASLRLKAALTGLAGVGLGLFSGWAFSFALDHHGDSSARGMFAVAMMMLPALLIVYGLLCSAATWNSKDRRGAAHFTKPRVRDVFLTREWTVITLAAATALILSAWGLHRHGVNGWLDVWPVTVVITTVMWWFGSRAILNRPSRAATSLELQWDDLLRYQRVRNFHHNRDLRASRIRRAARHHGRRLDPLHPLHRSDRCNCRCSRARDLSSRPQPVAMPLGNCDHYLIKRTPRRTAEATARSAASAGDRPQRGR